MHLPNSFAQRPPFFALFFLSLVSSTSRHKLFLVHPGGRRNRGYRRLDTVMYMAIKLNLQIVYG